MGGVEFSSLRYVASEDSEDTPFMLRELESVLRNRVPTTMADLLGRRVLVQPAGPPPQSLLDFAKDKRLPAVDVQMLSTIKFRGEPPRTAQRWEHIYNAIRLSERMDEDN